MKVKTKNFLFGLEKEFTPKDKYDGYMKKMKPKNYTKAKTINM